MPGVPNFGLRVRLFAAFAALLWLRCVRGDDVELPPVGDGGSAEALCLSAMLYLVQVDQFTFLSGGRQTIDGSGRSRAAGGFGWRPEIEPRVKSHLDLYKYDGEAKLLWNDIVVDALSLDEAFLSAQKVRVLAYRAPDGTEVEYHVYAKPDCGRLPAAVSTRAELLALEQ